MSSQQADAVTTWLAGARWDVEHGSIRSAAELYAPRLLAAVEAVLAVHKRTDEPVVTNHVCAEHSVPSVHSYRDMTQWRAAVEACGKCMKIAAYACDHCQRECPDDDEWPCPTYEAVSAALLGEGGQ